MTRIMSITIGQKNKGHRRLARYKNTVMASLPLSLCMPKQSSGLPRYHVSYNMNTLPATQRSLRRSKPASRMHISLVLRCPNTMYRCAVGLDLL